MTGNHEVVGSNPARVDSELQKHTLHKYTKQAQITYQYIANVVPEYLLVKTTFQTQGGSKFMNIYSKFMSDYGIKLDVLRWPHIYGCLMNFHRRNLLISIGIHGWKIDRVKEFFGLFPREISLRFD